MGGAVVQGLRHGGRRAGRAAILVLLLAACASGETAERGGSFTPLAGSGLSALLAEVPDRHRRDPFLRTAIRALEEGRLKDASAGLNRALKFDPQNARLHFLNGLVYHLRAEAGDASLFELAEVGYRLALQFDPGDAAAARQLGYLKYRQQRFREAQDAFAYALLLEPEDVTSLQGLAAASYYARDLDTASAAIAKALERAGGTPRILRTAAMIAAAAGRFDEAETFAARYDRQSEVSRYRVRRLFERVAAWKRLHREGLGPRLAQFTEQEATEGLEPGQPGDEPVEDDAPGDRDAQSKRSVPRMVLVDVTIIRSEERRTTDKGINLLNGLQLVLSGNLLEYQRNRTEDFLDPTSGTSTRVINKAFTLAFPSSGITYNLNIFNDNNDRNEVLARPTLVALDGKPSEFFSGAAFHVELTGSAGSEGDVQEVPVGLRLKVTPRFIDDETVELSVEAGRAFVEQRSSSIGFSNFAQVSKTTLSANVALRFGETLVLSGLSEREDEFVKDGVPLLQNLPGVQYFFAHEDTLEFKKSVIILLTPRKPRFAYGDGTARTDPQNPPDAASPRGNLAELRARPGWFRPAANLDAALQHLSRGRLFREFRAGDVTLERWEEPGTLATVVKRTLRFLYF